MPAETPPPKVLSPGTTTSSSTCGDKSRPKTPASVPASPQEISQIQTVPNPQTQQSPTAGGGANSGSGSTSGSQQFCLRWNNYQTNLTSVFDQLLQNESFVDVTLACDGQSIKAHKMVLSACSPYFQALFFDNPCQHPIIIMRDIKWPELKAAVEFMYKGEINVSQDQIGPLLRVAEMLKIRGLADVNGEQDATPAATPQTSSGSSEVANKKARVSREWELSNVDANTASANRNRKRRWPSGDAAGADSPLGGGGGCGNSTPDNNDVASPVAGASAATGTSQMPHQAATPNTMPSFPIPTPLESMGLPSLGMSHADDMEIKPGIAEMIREEERAKLMENSHAWLGASTSSIADSYQYQLQSMWQKCWNTNQNLMHHLRFRERGPLKSWRPETMAEAIFSVLKEGLSLSQAARKYDIPYPTFVLYANRVHNMLGPSIDGGTDLRPKGRGRPQRILLGIWPDEHIKGVIKTVVFRDAKELKDDGMHLSYGRHSPVFPFQEGTMNYPGAPCANGLPNQSTASVADSMSPEATAAAVAAVAHGIRQQMQMAAAAQHHNDAASNLFNLPAHLQHSSNQGVSLPKQNSPASSGQLNSNQQRHTSPSIPGLPNAAALGLSGIPNMHIVPGLNSSTSHAAVASASSVSHSSNASNHQTTVTPAHMSLNTSSSTSAPSNASRNESPLDSAHDLRMNSPEESPLNSPLGMPLEPAVNLAVGVSGMAYKPSRGYSSPRPEHLFQEDIADLVGGNASRNCPPNMNSFKEPPSGIKIEPMAECRSE